MIYALSAAMRFGFQVGYARMLGVAGFGRFAYALNWGHLLSPVSTLGFSLTVLGLVPVYEANEQWGRLRGLVRRARQVTTAVGIAVGATAIVVTLLVASDDSRPSLVIGFALVPVLGLMLLHQELLRALRRQLFGYTLALLLQPATAMGAAIVIYALAGRLTAVQALIAFGAAGVLIVIAEMRAVARSHLARARHVAIEFDDRRWRTTSGGLFVAQIFQRLILQTDIALVGLLLGPRDAGLYAAASRVAGVSSLITEAVNSILAPEIARLHAAGDRAALQGTVDSGVRLTFWPSLVVFGVSVTFASQLLALFGDSFSGAAWVLVLLALGNLINAATGPCGYLLALTGHERTSAKIAGIHAVLNVMMTAALIPAIGRNGAALASALVFASLNVTITVTAKRLLGVSSYPRVPTRLARR